VKSIGIINPLDKNDFEEFKENSTIYLEKIPQGLGVEYFNT